RRCRVDEGLVRKIKEEQASSSAASADNPQIARKVERNGKTFEMKTGNIGKKNEVKSPSHQLRDPDKVRSDGGHAQQLTTATDQRAFIGAHDDALSAAADARSSEDAQLQELMSAWSRASEKVRRRFLASVGVSQAGPHLAEPEPFQATPTTEPQENPLFEMW